MASGHQSTWGAPGSRMGTCVLTRLPGSNCSQPGAHNPAAQEPPGKGILCAPLDNRTPRGSGTDFPSQPEVPKYLLVHSPQIPSTRQSSDPSPGSVATRVAKDVPLWPLLGDATLKAAGTRAPRAGAAQSGDPPAAQGASLMPWP